MKNIFLIAIGVCCMACSCSNKTSTNADIQAYQKISPDFNADSAYKFVDTQVAFGPRVPNTPQHVACGDYLVAELKRFGAQVQEQKVELRAYDGTRLNVRNIIGSFGVEKKNRVLLFAHWDTRPFSDHDPDKKNWHKPVLGANDGASGVGVLLEVARAIQAKDPAVGVEIIFFDAEDYGPPAFLDHEPQGDWWCLGTQYWAKNPHIPNYKARFGILLDMVGAPNATFYKEETSQKYAKNVTEKVWSIAMQLDYDNYFIPEEWGGVIDDHLYVNELRNVSSIDIIHLDKNTKTGFGSYWHTQKDDMSNVNKETLKAVGQTVLEVIYKEK